MEIANSNLIKMIKQLFKKMQYGSVLAYSPINKEAGGNKLLPILSTLFKQIYLPVVLESSTELMWSEFSNNLHKKDYYGIKIPNSKVKHFENIKNVKTIIVPGIGFDRSGNRLGKGKGFYDRFLEKNENNIPIIGLAYDFQVVNLVPTDLWDKKVDIILTPSRIIDCKKHKI